MNLAQVAIGNTSLKHPDAVAIEIIGPPLKALAKTSWTYKQLDHDIRAIASGLIKEASKNNFNQGDFLLLRLNSDASFVLNFFATIAAGFTPVPLSPQLTNEEVDFFIKDTKAKAAILAENLQPPETNNLIILPENKLLAFTKSEQPTPYSKKNPDDPAFLIYTSGTTSKPKGVLHAQRVIKGRRPMIKGWHDIGIKDRVLHAGDYNWTYTIGIGLMDPWVQGATALIYHGEKRPELWPDIIAKTQATIFAAVPSLYRQILKYGDNLNETLITLRHGLVAGEALSINLKEKWETITNVPLYEGMGQSEISTYISTSPHIKLRQTPCHAGQEPIKGRVQPGRKVAILPVDKNSETPLPPNTPGIIAVHKSDPGLMLKYWQREKEQAEHFIGPWFLTGDLGQMDEQDNIIHLGRENNLMNASGYRVSPEEVETALLTSPYVHEAAVFEQSVRDDLSIITAIIIALPSVNETEETIISHLKTLMSNKLAAYKCPKSYYLRDSLPRNRVGKIRRSELEKLISLPQK